MHFQKGDIVELLIDNPSGAFLHKGDRGEVAGVTEDGEVAVEFDFQFEESHDCEGLVKSNNGWFINSSDLKKI
jgi:hypothetical protein